MQLLVLGGTVYLSRYVAETALRRGHRVTVACRLLGGPAPAGAVAVRLDRRDDPGLHALDGLGFDAVVDVSNHPGHVRAAVAALDGRVGHRTYVSTGKVYADLATVGQRAASAAVVDPAGPDRYDDTDPQSLGPRDVACERFVLAGTADAFVVRPGLIVGPHDPNDRFGYWPLRLRRGGAVLVPGRPSDPVQFIDVRDLAEWIVDGAERGRTGVFDAVRPALPRGEFLAAVAGGLGVPVPDLVWIDDGFLVAHGVRPWSGAGSLPLWMPGADHRGFFAFDPTDSLRAGLRVRPVTETVATTAAWNGAAEGHHPAAGLAEAHEQALLHDWAATSPPRW